MDEGVFGSGEDDPQRVIPAPGIVGVDIVSDAVQRRGRAAAQNRVVVRQRIDDEISAIAGGNRVAAGTGDIRAIAFEHLRTGAGFGGGRCCPSLPA